MDGGDTLFLAQEHKDIDDHLWFILSDPSRNEAEVVLASVTTLRDYKEKMFREAKVAADELTRMSQDLGLYDLEGPPPKGP